MGLLDDKKLLELYRQHWSKRYGPDLSDGELEDIYRNLNGFFNVLLDWHAADKAKAAAQPLGNPEQLPQENGSAAGGPQGTVKNDLTVAPDAAGQLVRNTYKFAKRAAAVRRKA